MLLLLLLSICSCGVAGWLTASAALAPWFRVKPWSEYMSSFLGRFLGVTHGTCPRPVADVRFDSESVSRPGVPHRDMIGPTSQPKTPQLCVSKGWLETTSTTRSRDADAQPDSVNRALDAWKRVLRRPAMTRVWHSWRHQAYGPLNIR